jgi:hypothetical protein
LNTARFTQALAHVCLNETEVEAPRLLGVKVGVLSHYEQIPLMAARAASIQARV